MRILLAIAITACAAPPPPAATTSAAKLELPGAASRDLSVYVSRLCEGLGTVVFVADPVDTPCDQTSQPVAELSLWAPVADGCGDVCCSVVGEDPPAVGSWQLAAGAVTSDGTTGVTMTEIDEVILAGSFAVAASSGVARGSFFAAPRCD